MLKASEDDAFRLPNLVAEEKEDEGRSESGHKGTALAMASSL